MPLNVKLALVVCFLLLLFFLARYIYIVTWELIGLIFVSEWHERRKMKLRSGHLTGKYKEGE